MTAPTPPGKQLIAKAVPKRSMIFYPRTTAEWSYSYMVAASAGVVFLARFLTDGPIAAVFFTIPALVGFFFRRPSMPMIAVIFVTYFLFAPGLVPTFDSNTLRIRLGHFDPMNMILASAVLIYLFAQYRLFALNERAMPNDNPHVTKADTDPHLRKIDGIPKGERIRLFFIACGCVVVAEIAWLAITEYYVEPALSNPIRLARPPGLENSMIPGSLPAPASRLLLLSLGIATFVFVTKMAFWYWRLRRLNPQEGTATIADMGWSENRREYLRNESRRARVQSKMNRDAP
ncbi:MAG: hypothetical protein U0798_10585 [Gemmataceae bacterium]